MLAARATANAAALGPVKWNTTVVPVVSRVSWSTETDALTTEAEAVELRRTVTRPLTRSVRV